MNNENNVSLAEIISDYLPLSIGQGRAKVVRGDVQL
jgi:hypothetical protein